MSVFRIASIVFGLLAAIFWFASAAATATNGNGIDEAGLAGWIRKMDVLRYLNSLASGLSGLAMLFHAIAV